MTQGRRPRHTRTRAGCLTCRSRKKKCDEVKPRCAGCRRNQLACDWPPDSPDDCGKQLRAIQATSFAQSPFIVCCTQPFAKIYPPMSAMHGVSERACGLTPQSTLLLGHYLRETVSFFAMTPMKDNPFITILLPLAYMDDLLMHGLLAFSGAHMSYKEPNSIELATATRLHYAQMISGLRSEFANLERDDYGKMERLLRVLIVACHYEVVSGDTQAAIFNHLRASRHLILSLLANKPTNKSLEYGWQSTNLDALGFSIELFSYLVSSNSITPHGVAAERTLPLDAFVMSLEELEAFPTFGALFAGGHELYRLVPEISLLASRRLEEEAAGAILPTTPLTLLHDDIHSRIMSWKMPSPPPGETTEDWEHKNGVAEAFRRGLHIYLATALAASTVTDPAVICSIQDDINVLFSYAPKLMASQFTATMLWPFVIAGTCLVKPEQRKALVREMRTLRYNMKHLEIIADTLELLWEDPDPRAYGPYGLYLTMEKHNVNICLA